MCSLFLETLEKTRQKFSTYVYGYVVMPEHVHLMLGEPASGTLAEAIHFLKLSSAKRAQSGEPTDNGQRTFLARSVIMTATFAATPISRKSYATFIAIR